MIHSEKFINKFQNKFFDEITNNNKFTNRAIFFGDKGYFIFCKFTDKTEKVVYFPYYKYSPINWIQYIEDNSYNITECQIETLLTHKSNAIRRFAATKIKEIRNEHE